MIIDKLNSWKDEISELRTQAVQDLPPEALPQFSRMLDQLQGKVNETAGWLEKYLQDELAYRQMQLELERQMSKIPLYGTCTPEQREAIVDKIIDDKGKKLLDEPGFHDYVDGELRKLPEDKLILKSYKKDDIIRLGKAVFPVGSAGEQYKAGLQSLEKTIKDPTGYDDAVSWGVKRVMADPKSRNAYLLSYYGVS